MQERTRLWLKTFQKSFLVVVLVLSVGLFSGCGVWDDDDDDDDSTAEPGGINTIAMQIEGLGEVECRDQDDTIACRGIPYAQPPVGDLRWKPPEPVEPWDDVREAIEWPNRAPQPEQEARDLGAISEDCLYLNLVMPAESEDLLPVMVFFHGGGLNTHTGNSEVYNNTALPLEGVVVVTVNSRLGAMGYLAHPALTAESENNASGNYGTLDMIESLKWVRDHIHNFGGDNTNVTIFGESGGGTKVISLLTSPLAADLFHRAIVQSGSSSVRYPTGDLATNHANGEALQAALGIEGEPADAATLAAMRAKTMEEIVAVDFSGTLTVDGWVLRDTVSGVFEAGNHNNVSFMVGAQTRDLGTPGASDLEAGVPTLANYMSADQPNTYVYVFSHLPANWRVQEACAAFHGLELPYVFGRIPEGLDSPIVAMFAQPLCTGLPGYDAVDDTVAEYGVKLWAQFAKTGNPNYPGIENDIDGADELPAYTAEPGNDYYLEIAYPMQVGTDPASAYIPAPEVPMPDFIEHHDADYGFTIGYPETWTDGNLLDGEILRKATTGSIPIPVVRAFVRPVSDGATLQEVFEAQLAAEVPPKMIGDDYTFDLSPGELINGETYDKAVVTYTNSQYDYASVIIGTMINSDTQWIIFEVYTIPQYAEFEPSELPDAILDTVVWD